MKVQLNFRSKMFLVYATVVAVFIIGLAISFSVYMSRTLTDSSYSALEQSVQRMSAGIDSMVARMDNISTVALLNKDLQEILIDSSEYRSGSRNYFDIAYEQRQKVNNILFSVIGTRNIPRRVTIFNGTSNYVSLSTLPSGDLRQGIDLEKLPWLRGIGGSAGNSILLTSPEDLLIEAEQPAQVIALVRKILYSWGSSSTLGYIAVEEPYSMLEDIVNTSVLRHSSVTIADSSGTVVYPLSRQGRQEDADASDGLVYSTVTSSYNWTITGMMPRSYLLAPVYNVQRWILAAGAGLIATMSLILFIITSRLTAPIRQMRKSLAAVSLMNPSLNLSVQGENNEIILLNKAFRRTFDRLQESMNETVRSRSKEMEARMRSLQAQMNPHFLFNSLMAISAVGQEEGSGKVVEMCSVLGQMLRYIADYGNESASLADEIRHAENYLTMQKYRYEDQLSYRLDFDPGMEELPLPKLVLQPIVENAFHHAFAGKKPPYVIQVKGALLNGRWALIIRDNGAGFPPGKLEELRSEIRSYDRTLSDLDYDRPLQIGGMALLNIYARLSMMYKTSCQFEIGNHEDGGAEIAISGHMPSQRTGE